MYLTAHAQNAAPRIFALSTYQTYQNGNALVTLKSTIAASLSFYFVELIHVRISDC